ncbi:MAG: hypothetical protein HQM04_04175 [Magnetococcales bacterium]|nr:hypothetical protein [Magnetococcales bacterium]MBF0114220.1 hypothetical protein [Magnetococcales bacterium]
MNHLPALLDWVEARLGLQMTASNQENVWFAVQTLAKQAHLSPDDYMQQLMYNQCDQEPFIHRVTVHESYFLRSRAQMEYVVKQLIPGFLQRRPGETVRILSIACAQGEEPYSLAMLCKDAGWSASQVEIHGIDLSAECIELARTGCFTRHAVRGVEESFLRRHFIADSSGRFTIQASVRDFVRFEAMHFPRESLSRLLPGYPVIFCQNLLFYLTKPELLRALEELRRLLYPEGWLYLDGASSAFPKTGFCHVHKENVHAFRLAATLPVPVAKPVKAARKWGQEVDQTVGKKSGDQLLHMAWQKFRLKQFPQSDHLFEQVLHEYPALQAKALLGKARIQADEGQQMQAMELAEKALAHQDGQYAALTRMEAAEACAIIALTLHGKGLLPAARSWFALLKQFNPQHPANKLFQESS